MHPQPSFSLESEVRQLVPEQMVAGGDKTHSPPLHIDTLTNQCQREAILF